MLEKIDPLRLDDPQEREKFLVARRQGIGSSDVAGILGLSNRISAMHVYLSKLGELPDHDTKAKRSGRLLENVVATLYAEFRDAPVFYPANAVMQHPTLPWMLASPDRLVSLEGELRIVECKTTHSLRSDDWGTPGTGEIPDWCNLQVQQQMAVANINVADVAVLVGGQDLHVYTVERSGKLIERLALVESDFWAKVERREPPGMDYFHPETLGLLKRLYAVEEHKHILLGEEAEKLAELDRKYKEAMDVAGLARDAARAELLQLMADAGTGRLPGGGLVIRQRVSRKAYSVPATEYTTLKIRCPKQEEG